ncbi:MAG: tetratricopeptide repeat protein, partial [Deltaproteobacteria bacterium]|nr:tetratricopeptide repeat protein [Deltaproteobacteria bacterium]
TVTGTITDPKNPCGLPKGTVVLSGARLDDSVAGTLKTCKFAGAGCSGLIEGETILLVTKGGAQLSGTAHFEAGTCKTPLGQSITLKKPALAKAALPPKPKVTDLQRAETLAREAQPLLQSGNAEEARKKCQEAVKIDPGFSQGYTCVGVSFYLRERYEEALEQYKKALEADPGNRDVYYNIGCVHVIQGRTAEALDYLRLALLNGYVDVQTLANDSDLKSLNGNAAFEKLKAGELD